MKTSKYKLVVPLSGALFLGVIGCTDLDDKVLDRPSANDLSSISGQIDPKTALASVYSQLNGLADQANVYAMQEHSTDEMMGPTRGTDWSDFGTWRRLHQHSWDALHNQVITAWDVLNTGVFRANQAAYFAGASSLPAEDKKQVTAEARFMRAFFMSQLVDLYGQVPYREATDDPQSVPKVFSRSEATDFILQDLQAALPDLKPNTSAGVATTEAVQFLLAKMHLNQAVYKQDPAQPSGPFNFAAADMNKVIEYCDAIINSGRFQLEPQGEYFDNFHWNNTTLSKEIVFAIVNAAGSPVGNARNRYYMTLHYNQKPSSWNGFTTLADFYGSFEAQDERVGKPIPGMTDQIGLRAGFLVGQQFNEKGEALKDRGGNPLVFTPDVNLLYSDEKKGIRVIKYLPQPDNLDNPGNDYVFYRYADVILMKAEAILRGGAATGGATAESLVNGLRTTRGASVLATVDLPALLAERGRELYWEGWRRNDMIRFGTFLNPFDQKPQASPAHVVVYPIPQRALDTNPNLKQNVGYSQ